MAFYIKTKSYVPGTLGSKCTEREVTWYINQEKPFINGPEGDAHAERIVSIQADGNELEHVRKTMPNVPITIGGVCTWRYEMAQFVYDNLSRA